MILIDLRTARVDALFASDLSSADQVVRASADAAIAKAVRTRHVRGCVEHVAAEFGEHPETAVLRMRWAVSVFNQLYGRKR